MRVNIASLPASLSSLQLRISGPLELTRRTKVLVWDEELEVAEEAIQEVANSPSSPRLSINSVPLPRRTRSQSSGSEFPPPIRRTSTDASGAPRPVPFAAKFQRVHPGTTGVTVLEHLERLDAVEASLQRLGVDETMEEEVDVGVVTSTVLAKPISVPRRPIESSSDVATSPFSPPGSPLPTVHEVSSSASSIAEEDLVALSKSTSHIESANPFNRPDNLSTAGIEWIQTSGESQKRTVITEVCIFALQF
jgi:phosphatidylinositol 4-kinase type 2